jgi:hypothetical protein
VRLGLDISDGFNISPWVNGFISFDLSDLEDMPGVDVDRRILRFAFFAELTFRVALKLLDQERMESSSAPSPSLKAQADGGDHSISPAFKEGGKVELVNIEDDQDGVLCNVLEGCVISRADQERYLISFANLEETQTDHACNLTAL